MSRAHLVTLLVALILALGVSVAPVQAADASASPQLEQGPAQRFRIGPEDTLQISVWKNEAMSRTVPVRPDGMVSLPLVNDVEAAGLTPMELRDLLTKKLAEYIPNPEVSVTLTDVRSFKVSVIGEVAKPARYELKAWTTVLDVLAMAGGFTQFAARTRIVVLRPNGKAVTRIPFNYSRLIAASADQENFYLQPGDIVLVP
jgi:polysaccharide biosynthesis/export protein